MKPRNLIFFTCCTFVLAVALAAGAFVVSNMLTVTRGVTYPPPGSTRTPIKFGVNADLDQYSDADLQRALTIIRDVGFTLVRQHFYWKDIEPRQGEFQWDRWDRIVARTKEYGLGLVAVIDTTPVWARDLGEADLDYAPPIPPKNPEPSTRTDDYARFVATFTRRYDRITFIQIWDNPNVHPFWGRHNADPFEYTALLRSGAIAARAANPNVKIISAGLAPSGELIRGHPDYSDVLFLREMYETGARDYMDIVGIKPYGMWSGPDDRRADKDIFNFSRAIVLRDEMIAHGDATKPMWAVEFGWNTLPKDWRGTRSPWGTDTEQVQSVRLAAAIQRAKAEWAWMDAMILQTFQPNAPSDDPVWGFSLVDKDLQPRAFYSAMTSAMSQQISAASFDFAAFYGTLAALAVVALVSTWRGIVAARSIPWRDYWRAVESRFTALPEFAQLAIPAIGVVAFYYSQNTLLNFALLALIMLLFALRLDLGLAVTVFTIPFYLLPKNLIGGAQFSLVELLTLASTAAWGLKNVSRFTFQGFKLNDLKREAMKLGIMDWAVLFFVLAGLFSVRIAANFGVANREFRVIVLEPALLYALVRASNLTSRDMRRLIDALMLSALTVSLIGLYQFFFTNWVIVGEGVRRILAVYGSPNNLALYLDRVLPILVALIVFGGSESDRATSTLTSILSLSGRGRRLAYALAAIPIALCLYLTYSRAALLFGLPAGLAFIALVSGRRARIGLGALFIVGIIALVPFMQTERWQSLFQTGTGTGFFRVSVWQSAIEMIRDHPIFGVGLDNFLYEYPKYIKPEAWREPNLSHPHNIILDFWARMGILGVIALAWMVFDFYRAGVRTITPTPALPLGKGEGPQGRAVAIALMAGMTAGIAHGMIDAAYFFVDLALVWMLTLAIMTNLKLQITSEAQQV